METIPQALERWSQSLCRQVSIAGLVARNPIAHKWRSPFRCLVVREALFWRMHDLSRQAQVLIEAQCILGARILIRSAIETVALLSYLCSKMEDVVENRVDYEEFDQLTKQLVMGSRNQGTSIPAVNILTAIKWAERLYPGLTEMYAHFSESAHPNYDGLTYGYSALVPEDYVTNFQDNWVRNFGEEQLPALTFLMAAFENDYSNTWCTSMEKLEAWLSRGNELLDQLSDS